MLLGKVDEDVDPMVEVLEALAALTVEDRVTMEVVEMLVVGEVVIDALLLVIGDAVTVGLTVTVAVELRTPSTS